MDEAGFWAIIADSRSEFDPGRLDENYDRQVERLEAILSAMPLGEVVAFEWQFQGRMSDAYRWDLWAVPYIVEGGCSDDSFTDFRSWLIAMGREVFEAALRDPESLLDLADRPGLEVVSFFEEFQSVARQVYEEKTGDEIPDEISDTRPTHPRDPEGKRWDPEGDDLARRFPRLWAKYGDE